MLKISKIKRAFGFNSDNSGIMTRYLEESLNWKQHLHNTKDFILKNAEGKEKNTCLILGSGWCLDVPVTELSEIFNTVILADIIHPRQVEHKFAEIPNVSFLTVDITGILEPLYFYHKRFRYKVNFKEYISGAEFQNFIQKINPDYIVSVNILSQLSYFPVKFIIKHHLANTNDQQNFKKAVENNHLNILPAGKSVLITDYYEYEYGINDIILNKKNRLSVSLSEKKIQKEWIWNFDLSGNYYTGNPVKFKVAALQV